MAAPIPIPAARLADAPNPLATLDPEDLLYVCCNVGDGDAQVILLPADPGTVRRQAIVVDAALAGKVPSVLNELRKAELLQEAVPGSSSELGPGAIALVVASHPHQDHIGAMAELLRRFGESVDEFWDPGYFHEIPAYLDMMKAIEAAPMLYAQPTSGLRRWIENVELIVLSPSILLRNRFDSYGVELNDSSLSIRLEFPSSRVLQLDAERNYVGSRNTQALILGADAQTLSWAYALMDFPYLQPSTSAVAKALRMASGSDPMAGQVLKVSHHASKHGVNLELIERIKPALTIVSCAGGGGSYGFPHTVAQEVIREGLEPTTRSGRVHAADPDLGIFYTSDTDDEGVTLGSFAIAMSKGRWRMWRLGDGPREAVSFNHARLWT